MARSVPITSYSDVMYDKLVEEQALKNNTGVCVSERERECVCVCVCVCKSRSKLFGTTLVCTHQYILIHTCVHIYTHTHIHAHSQKHTLAGVSRGSKTSRRAAATRGKHGSSKMGSDTHTQHAHTRVKAGNEGVRGVCL
jgi:hypothetical protein